MLVCTHECRSQRTTAAVGILLVPPTLFCETGSPRLGLTDQVAPGSCLSPPPQHWDCKPAPPHPALFFFNQDFFPWHWLFWNLCWVDQTNLTLKHLPVSTSWVLGLTGYSTMDSSHLAFYVESGVSTRVLMLHRNRFTISQPLYPENFNT